MPKDRSNAGVLAQHDTRPTRLGVLEVGRAFAAIIVVMHHASQASDGFTTGMRGAYFDWGAFGVDFFFVLSGFIIYHVHHNDPRGIAAAFAFSRKRLRRIFTPYLPVSIVMILAYLALPGLSQGNRDWGLLTSLTLLPTDAPPVLSVAWTLVFEMVFYVFFLTFYATRFFWTLVVAWGALTAGVALLWGGGPETSGALILRLLNPLILEFIAGMLAAYLFHRSKGYSWCAPLILGCLMLVAFCFVEEVHRIFLGFSFASLILGLAMAEEKFTFRIPKPILLLGAASYAIYLVHNPVQSLVARVLQKGDSWFLTFTICCLAGVALGVLYHLFYERPILRWLPTIRGHSSLMNNKKGRFI